METFVFSLVTLNKSIDKSSLLMFNSYIEICLIFLFIQKIIMIKTKTRTDNIMNTSLVCYHNVSRHQVDKKLLSYITINHTICWFLFI